ncbi:uncharacterized protein LOC104895702 [Beta vulgaris subsp. vulgaris]|uniref:uncharacterized protein LOC104895702 n=1 Tax=Beta vulgaris subsp. vulgaris TaxID=3555 RepID=UPI0020367100|nr:uncharacterized protein LOC104895702 [Beta vulgaris subsp. vulgaris]XP_048501866.1 uncharacterized protein LOC104895702 [Beta vulgaris subsp. vulgaris]
MGEDKSGKLKEKEVRPPLGDVTNQLGKRPFSLISRSPASKSKSGNNQISDESDTDSNFWKQVSLVVEKLEKERSSVSKCPKISNEVGLSPLKGGKTYRLLNSSGKGLQNVVHPAKGTSSSVLDSIVLDAVNLGDAAKESRVLGVKVGESSICVERDHVEGGKECQNEETRASSYVADNDSTHEVLGTQVVVSDDCGNLGVEGLTTSRSESVVSSRLTESQEIKGFGLERCAALKKDGGCSFAAGMDLLKQCSCSFCTKAAYMWSDLHYQDVKGRISILAKSQKDASNLAQKYSVENEMGRHAQPNSSDAAQIEADLTTQWRSLFLHLEDMFGSEGSQLQNSFLALKDLREDFKINLESITGIPLDMQQSSSDASDHTIV